jgi:hypothetical protein
MRYFIPAKGIELVYIYAIPQFQLTWKDSLSSTSNRTSVHTSRRPLPRLRAMLDGVLFCIASCQMAELLFAVERS